MSRSFALPVTDASQIGEVRRLTLQLAGEIGLNETCRGQAGIVATELATNLQRYARGGVVCIRAMIQAGEMGIEILAWDQGPGMEDVNRCMQDGYSSGGTSGNGLGSVKRLSTVFDIYSTAQGTLIVSQIWAGGKAKGPQLGAICLPYPGETACGDGWAIYEKEKDQGFSLILADGLGHGVQAAEASELAIRLHGEYRTDVPAFLLQRLHQAMRSTRGAAVMVFEAQPAEGTLVGCGVGNISGSVLRGAESRSMLSQNGTVGHQAAKIQEFGYSWQAGSLLIAHSDGIQGRWRLDGYPGLLFRHPALIAAALFREFRREKDDATVVVVRQSFQS